MHLAKKSLALIFCASFFLWLLLPTTSSAQEESKDPLLFVGPSGARPYIYSEGGQQLGIMADITRELSDILGRKINIRVLDFREARRMVRDGEADAVMPMSFSVERMKQYDYPTPIFNLTFTVFARENERHPEGWPNLEGVRVGVFGKGMSVFLAKKWYPKAQLITVKGSANAMTLVQQSEIDAMVTTRRSGNQAIYQNSISNVVALPITLMTTPAGLAVRKGNTVLRETLNQAINKLHEKGKIAGILDKWEQTRIILFTKREVWIISGITAGAVAFVFLILGTFYVHQRRRSEKRLKEGEEFKHNLLTSTAEAIYGLDLDGNCTFCNPACLKILGFESEEELLGQHIHNLIHHTRPNGEPYPANECLIYKAFQDEKGSHVDNEVLWRKDGTSFPVEYWSYPIFRNNKTIGSVVAFLDITERKQVEEELHETRAQLDIAIESIADGFALFDGEDRFVFANSAYRESHKELGDTELPGMKFEEIVRHLASKGFYGNTPQEKEEFIEKRLDSFRSGKPFEYCTDGKHTYEVHEYKTSDNGIALVRREITERKHLEEQARHAQKMEAVGHLTGGIAHDFNNILGIVMGNLEIIQRLAKNHEKILGRTETALKGARRGADLTRKLLGFSRKDAHGTELISINGLIGDLEEFLSKSLTVEIAISNHLDDNLWPVSVDPGDLQDAILNLTLNARDAMPNGGSLVIETANKTLDQAYVDQNPDSKIGDFVMLSLTDSGEGITPDIKDRVMEPFFTTKREGRGSGLGLSMVYGFVKRSGGHIHLYSEPGKGTTVNLYLPRTNEGQKYQESESIDVDLPRGEETILVVDDEEALVDIAVTYLEDLGYQTHSANNGKQALRVLLDHKEIDLIFTDVIMPGNLDGYQLAIAAQNARPSLKALLASGFTNKKEKNFYPDPSRYSKLSGNLLNKPYNQSELAFAVRDALDEHG
jgi:PAS domain S-box-containing protein